MRQHERGSLLVVERAHEFAELDIGQIEDRLAGRRDLLLDGPATDAPPDVVGADVARDREEPRAHRCVEPESWERLERPEVRLLGEILRLGRRRENCAKPKYGILRRDNEFPQRPVVTMCCGLRKQREAVIGHDVIVAEQRRSAGMAQLWNSTPVPGDPSCMDCKTIQAALSARADQESAGIPGSVVAWHLQGCADCAAFAASLDGIGPPPAAGSRIDLSTGIVAMAARIERGEVWWGMRAALLLISIGELVLAVPDLVGHASTVAGDVHMQRHLGAFQIAYAIGLIVVALRPAKARALVPLTAALAAAMVGAAIADIVQGITPALGETQHALELSGLLLVWLLAARRGWPGHARSADQPRRRSDRGARPPRPTLIVNDDPGGVQSRRTA